MKQLASPESQILPELTWEDMQPRLVERLRTQAVLQDPDHAWKDMTDEELVQNAELSRLNPDTGTIGFTLAALLLLGTDKAFRARFPLQGQGTQAVFRPGQWRRGEREDLRMNLLETHDRLMAFAARHLPEEWETTPKGETLNLRDTILSEIFSNSLIFRDYGRAYPARFVIESDRVFMENGMASGKKPGQKFSPNPLLANVFKQIGWGPKVAGLTAKGSQVSQWGKAYFGILPMVVEGSVYRILAPFPKKEVAVPAVSNSWDISEMLTTQAPWTHSKAAQNEVGFTRGALDTLIEGPILSDVESMQIPAPIEPLDMFGRPLVRAPAAVETTEKPLEASAAPEPLQPLEMIVAPTRQPPIQPPRPAAVAPIHGHTVAHTNGHTNGHTITPPLKPNQAAIQSERTEKILEFCKTPRYRSELQAHVGIVNRDYFRKDILNPLIEKGLLEPTLRDKPNSPKQQYATVGR